MAKTLGQIQQQIAKLQREAESIRKREISGVIARIRTAIDHYGLTAQDLFGAQAHGNGAARKVGAWPSPTDGPREAAIHARVNPFPSSTGMRTAIPGRRAATGLDGWSRP